jgi:hypothetical protein
MRSATMRGRGCLRGVRLGLAQLGYRDGEPGQAGQQRPGQDRAITAQVPYQRQEPRHRAQPVTVHAAAGDLPVGRAARP